MEENLLNNNSENQDNSHRYSIHSIQQYEPENKPLNEMSWAELFQQIKSIFFFTCSICGGMLLTIIILSINLHFVGKIDDPLPIDALGFAIIIINCTGGFLMLGFNQGCGSYIARAHGKGEEKLKHNYFNKGLLMFLCIFLIFALIMSNCEPILLFLGQHDELAKQTENYGSGILIGIFFCYLFDLLRNYLNGQEIYTVPTMILSVAIPIHYGLCSLMFDKYQVQATIYATNITYFLNFVEMVVYLIFIKKFPQISTEKLFWNIKDYAKEALAIALPQQIDIMGFEINSILIGLLGDLKMFGAHIAFSNYVSLIFSFPVGMGATFMLITSNAVGKNHLTTVKNYFNLGIMCGILFGSIFVVFQLVFKNYVASYYTVDPEIQYHFQSILIIYVFLCIPDFIAQTFAGYIKGIGKSKEGLYFFVLCYYVLGLPLSAFLGLGTSLKLQGFWIGFGFSVVSILTVMFFYIKKSDLEQQVSILYNKLLQDSEHLKKQQQQQQGVEMENFNQIQ